MLTTSLRRHARRTTLFAALAGTVAGCASQQVADRRTYDTSAAWSASAAGLKPWTPTPAETAAAAKHQAEAREAAMRPPPTSAQLAAHAEEMAQWAAVAHAQRSRNSVILAAIVAECRYEVDGAPDSFHTPTRGLGGFIIGGLIDGAVNASVRNQRLEQCARARILGVIAGQGR